MYADIGTACLSVFSRNWINGNGQRGSAPIKPSVLPPFSTFRRWKTSTSTLRCSPSRTASWLQLLKPRGPNWKLSSSPRSTNSMQAFNKQTDSFPVFWLLFDYFAIFPLSRWPFLTSITRWIRTLKLRYVLWLWRPESPEKRNCCWTHLPAEQMSAVWGLAGQTSWPQPEWIILLWTCLQTGGSDPGVENWMQCR